MPVDYTCRACTLKVSLGWYHFGSADDGYGSATQLMCGQCGAQHRIDMAISEEARAWMMRPVVLWDVVLADAGEHRVKVMHALHHELGCGLREAMALVRSIPVKLRQKCGEDEARSLQARLEAVGARVNLLSEPIQDVIERNQPSPPPLPASDVHLTEVGPNRMQVMYLIHTLTGCGREWAQALVHEAPVRLGYELEGKDAARLVLELEAAGARAHLTHPPPQLPPEARNHIGPYVPRVQDALLLGIPTSVEGEGGMEWRPCQVLGERTGETGHMELRLQRCGQCHAQGALLTELPAKVNPCPRCGQQTLEETGGWVT